MIYHQKLTHKPYILIITTIRNNNHKTITRNREKESTNFQSKKHTKNNIKKYNITIIIQNGFR